MKLPIYQVDAFASEVFKGNPAAVVPLDEWLEDELLQNIAMENNLSETAYLVGDSDGRDGCYELRWFTPKVEVPLCGHATLASAHVLWTHLDEIADQLTFATKSGDLLVTRDGAGRIVMDFPANRVSRQVDTEPLERVLGVRPDSVFAGDYVYTMAVMPESADIPSLQVDVGLIADIVAPETAALIITGPGKGDVDCVSRFFVPYAGIEEDPVTGSIHTAIVPYWAECLGKTDITAYQASARGGRLYCTDAGERILIRGPAGII